MEPTRERLLEQRYPLTPYMIACEFQRALAERMKVCPIEGDPQFGWSFPYDDPGILLVRVFTLGACAEFRITVHELMLSMDDFYERCIMPYVEMLHRTKDYA